jgi:signal transduction histidine kinase
VRDLIALSAIPAAWAGREPPAVAAGLADALVDVLQLDFAFVRLSYPDGAGAVDVTRGTAREAFPEWLEDHAAARVGFPRRAIVADLGDDSEPCRAVALPIGITGEGGLVAAASERGDFPTAVEQALLSLAANQAATAFQNASLIDERRRAEEELRGARDVLEVKVAERTGELHVANDELNALRRVATLVAEGVPPEDLFAVVAEEVARVLDVPIGRIVRYEPDGTATECASFSSEGPLFAAGKRWLLEGTNVVRSVRESSGPARIDDYSELEGETADVLRRSGIRSTVGVPIVAAGHVWGAMVVSTTEHEPLPQGIEARLADFTELLATAIENAESREALAQLADEQATLRRMATLVAQGMPPDEIFSAVSDEVGRLFGSDAAAVVRFDHDHPAIVFVGVSTRIEDALPIGTRCDVDDAVASAEVYRTGRSARVDAKDWSSLDGPIAAAVRRLGLASAVASPVVVEGRPWGALTISSAGEPLPLDTEQRLEKFTELVATAISNAESKSELAASRRRIVEASDEARRRIERDLHDGTQQRLVTLLLQLAAVREAAPIGEVLVAELSRLESELASALDEVHELSRGIHPSILSEGGLVPALRALARRSTIPVELDFRTERRLADPIEAAAYFVASEAVTNATKHAQASRIEVSLAPRDGSLMVSIRDDGVGGADSGGGSGLIGLHDRVEALGGTIRIESPPGVGTLLVVALPLEVEPTGIGLGSTSE